jgi:Protein of unknown function (DUF3568)
MHIQRMKLLVLLSVVVLGGCTKVYPDTTAGAGTYNPASGWLSWAYPAPLERSYQATLAALEGLDLRVQTKTLDGLEGRIKAIRADRTNVQVYLKPLTDRTTEVQVKVGTFGDQEQAELIHKNIRAQLRL